MAWAIEEEGPSTKAEVDLLEALLRVLCKRVGVVSRSS